MELSEHHTGFLTPKAEVLSRLKQLQKELDRQAVGAAWIGHNTDLLYYTGSMQDAVLLVPASGEPAYFVRASAERAASESPLQVRPFPGTKGLLAELRNMLPAEGALGMSLDVTPANLFLRLTQGLGNPEVKDIQQTIRLQRAVKSQWEIEQIRGATKQVEAAFDYIPTILKPGITELEFSADIEGFLRKAGHGGPLRLRRMGQELAMLMAVSGSSASYPTNFDGPVGGEAPYPAAAMGAGSREILSGEAVMTDIVTSYNGYHSDNARDFFTGPEPPRELLDAHEFCTDIISEIESAARPGRICSDVFKEIDALAKKRGEPQGFMGFGKNRVKFFGHGVGLELDELPVIADRVDIEIVPGMIIAVEPKAFLPHIGPAGIENTYVVEENGLSSLCGHPRRLIDV